MPRAPAIFDQWSIGCGPGPIESVQDTGWSTLAARGDHPRGSAAAKSQRASIVTPVRIEATDGESAWKSSVVGATAGAQPVVGADVWTVGRRRGQRAYPTQSP